MLRFDKILVPVDFSDNSRKAVLCGVEIAREKKAALTFLHVIDQGIIDSIQDLSRKGYKGDFIRICRDMAHERKEDLLRCVPEGMRDGLDVEFLVQKGKPAEQIIELANDRHIDLIVIGNSGRSAFEKALVGDVTRNVLNRANCPVLVVRHVEEKHDL